VRSLLRCSSERPFKTSRLAEFCSEKELVNQTGHDADDWPLVVLKELVDNALDTCEEAGIRPVISIEVADDTIIIADNGPGLPPGTVEGILDYIARVSSREAYVSRHYRRGSSSRQIRNNRRCAGELQLQEG
jgi:DNA topoisomerase VI subunit B